MRIKHLALLALSALALVSCGTAEQSQNVAATPSETAATASAESVSGASDGDPELFVKSINFRWIGEQQFSETELIDAGRDACEQMRDGVDSLETKSGLEGVSDENEHAIAVAAKDGFCAELQHEALAPSELPERIKPNTD
ncbi:hypothetical protein CQ012_02270 [Arthrobacter sp. MYb214]|uniref:hypothetical protein n=1 Tax=Arthrobacter sp. MYb214 TaxID=1848596 RepID=UPI000CFDF19D|nr:hypothetical protein [Arthrobacter sp. MYb214]PRB78235.1 hypothetical protein CQ012_02270 [Arthrobacter sp. MYb214]